MKDRAFFIRFLTAVSAAALSAAPPAHCFTGQADFIITLDSRTVPEEAFDRLASEYRFSFKYALSSARIAAVRLPPGMGVEAALALFSADTRIASAEPDYVVGIAGNLPDDLLFPEQWALYNPGNNRADVKAVEAWQMTRGRRSVVIGIIDTGIDYFHPDLAANIWTNSGEVEGNGRDDDGNGYVDDYRGWDFAGQSADPIDRHDHGTLMAGIAGAVTGNGIGVSGVMPEASLMAVKALADEGYGYSSDLVAAIYYAVDNGATVINASWGGGGYLQAMRDAIAYAGSRGVVFVAAAGNKSIDNDTSPFYPSSYDNDNIIAVAATGMRDSLAPFSHYGAVSVDIAAPGVSVISTAPRNRYRRTSGTSMAVPHVAACIGLLASYAPGLTYREYVGAVLGSAERLRQLDGLCVSAGRLDIEKALRLSVAKRRDIRYALYILKRLNTRQGERLCATLRYGGREFGQGGRGPLARAARRRFFRRRPRRQARLHTWRYP